MKGGVLFFYEKKGGKRKAKVALYKCVIEEYNPESSNNCFRVTPTTGKNIVLRAKNEQEMHKWLNSIIRQKVEIEDVIDCISV